MQLYQEVHAVAQGYEGTEAFIIDISRNIAGMGQTLAKLHAYYIGCAVYCFFVHVGMSQKG